jgi:phage host-nuclease inhibitor protein Gam
MTDEEKHELLQHDDGISPAESLGTHLARVNAPATTGPHGLVLDDDGKAEWALRLYGKYEQDAARVDAEADAYIAQVEAWRREQKARCQGKLALFGGALQGWFKRWREQNPREKSVKLVGGTVGERTAQPEVVRNDAALLAWLKGLGHDDLVKVKESPDWAELKRFCNLDGQNPVYKPTGEVIEAVTLIQREPSFFVKPSETTLTLDAADFAALPEPEGEDNEQD